MQLSHSGGSTNVSRTHEVYVFESVLVDRSTKDIHTTLESLKGDPDSSQIEACKQFGISQGRPEQKTSRNVSNINNVESLQGDPNAINPQIKSTNNDKEKRMGHTSLGNMYSFCLLDTGVTPTRGQKSNHSQV